MSANCLYPRNRRLAGAGPGGQHHPPPGRIALQSAYAPVDACGLQTGGRKKGAVLSFSGAVPRSHCAARDRKPVCQSLATTIHRLTDVICRTALCINGSKHSRDRRFRCIGSAMSEGLARAGANVAILGRNLTKAQRQAERLKAYGVSSLAIQADVTSKQALQSACDQIRQVWKRVDILVNAPGVNSAAPFFDITEEEWEQIMAINLKGVFLACQIFGKQMLVQQSGNIINISSMASGPPLSKVFTYSVSKAGLNNLTQNLAREWAGQGIRVNAILPGFFPAQQNKKILTPERKAAIFRHTPMGRFGESSELIGTLLWLAADKASSFVTGALIPGRRWFFSHEHLKRLGHKRFFPVR